MQDKTKVSVIVPVYDNAETVAGSLRSLFAQSLREIEIVAVDDASTDGSTGVLEAMAHEEPRLRVIRLQENTGAHEARAAGLRACTGAWIGFLDADDFARPEMYETLYKACRQDEADIAVCGSDRVSLNRLFKGRKVFFQRDEWVEDSIFERFCRMEFGMGSLCNKLYRRDLLLRHALASFRWRQDASEDTIVNIGCFLDARRIRLVHASLHEYIENPRSATRRLHGARAYVGMVRAFAAATDTYHLHGRRALDGISGLYRRLLAYDFCRVDRVEELAPYESDLAEAVSVLAERHPFGVALVAARSSPEREGEESLRVSLKKWARLGLALPKLLLLAIRRRAGGPCPKEGWR